MDNEELINAKRMKFKQAFSTIAEIIFDSLQKPTNQNDYSLLASEISNLIDKSSDKINQEDEIYTVEQLSDYLSVSSGTVYSWTHKKKIPYIKICGQLRFRKTDIDKLIVDNTYCLDLIENGRLDKKAKTANTKPKKRFTY